MTRPKKRKRRRVFMCGVAYQHEVGEVPFDAYISVAALKRKECCWKQCGIVECEVRAVRWVVKQKLPRGKR